MAEKAQLATVESLGKQIAACTTVTDLFKLASSQEFKDAAHGLSAPDLQALRAGYKARQTELDGRVKLEAFDGQTIQVIDIDYWHSDRFEGDGKSGDGVTLTFRPEADPSKKYKAVTSSASIVRYANTFNQPPSEAEPSRIYVKLVPVRDAERAAKGQRVWTVKRLAAPHRIGDGTEGSPF